MRFDNDASISRGIKDNTVSNGLVHKLFEDWVESHENDLTCIEEYGNKTTITYKELNERANSLAHVILKKITKG